MGNNSNKTRSRCKSAACPNAGTSAGLTRSASGLCRACMQTPAEAVILRPAMDKTIGVQGSWARGPLTWRDGVVARERLAQTANPALNAPQTPQTPIGAPASIAPATEAAGAVTCDSESVYPIGGWRAFVQSTPFIVALAVIALGVLGVWCYVNNEQAGIAQAQEVGK